jgi:hypothetical protein
MSEADAQGHAGNAQGLGIAPNGIIPKGWVLSQAGYDRGCALFQSSNAQRLSIILNQTMLKA